MLDTQTISQLPDWLTAPDPKPSIPQPPAKASYRDKIQLREAEFEAYFDTFLEQICEGTGPDIIFNESHLRDRYTIGKFMKWIDNDPQREEAFYAAQKVCAKVIEGQVLRIVDDPDSLEDIARISLKVKTRMDLMAKWDRKRHGDQKKIEMTSTTISINAALADANMRVISGLTIEHDTIGDS